MKWLLGVAALACLATPASAVTLFENAWDADIPFTIWCSPCVRDGGLRVFDVFTLGDASVLTGVTWLGVTYDLDENAQAADSGRRVVAIYDIDDTVRVTPLWEQGYVFDDWVDSTTRVDDGRGDFIRDIAAFSLPLPDVELAAGDYWLSVYGGLGASNGWVGVGGTYPGSATYGFRDLNDNMGFRLTGELAPFVAPVPVPAALPMLGLGIAGLIAFTRRNRINVRV